MRLLRCLVGFKSGGSKSIGHEIAARLPVKAEAAFKRATRTLQRLARTSKSRHLTTTTTTTAAALAASLAGQWKTDAAPAAPPAKALARAAALPAGVVLNTTLAP